MSVIQKLLESLEASVNEGNWYASLTMALILPDICSKIETPLVPTNKRYPLWFTTYMDSTYKWHMSGKDCYALRCSYLHAWNSLTEEQKVKEIIDKFYFIADGSHLSSFRNNYANSGDDGKNLCVLSVKKFSIDIKIGVNRWLEKYKDDSTTQEWIKGMLIINEDGLLLYWWMIKLN